MHAFRLLRSITALTPMVLFVHLLVPLPLSPSLGLIPVREAALLTLGASLRGAQSDKDRERTTELGDRKLRVDKKQVSSRRARERELFEYFCRSIVPTHISLSIQFMCGLGLAERNGIAAELKCCRVWGCYSQRPISVQDR